MLRKITVFLSVLALIAGLAIILAGPGVRAGLWSYMTVSYTHLTLPTKA